MTLRYIQWSGNVPSDRERWRWPSSRPSFRQNPWRGSTVHVRSRSTYWRCVRVIPVTTGTFLCRARDKVGGWSRMIPALVRREAKRSPPQIRDASYKPDRGLIASRLFFCIRGLASLVSARPSFSGFSQLVWFDSVSHLQLLLDRQGR